MKEVWEKEIYKVLLLYHRRSYHLHFIDLMSHPLHCLFTTKLRTESIVSAIIWYVAIKALLYGMIGAN